MSSHELPPLPRGWLWSRVGEVGEVRLGRQRSPKDHVGDYMRPYLRVANVYEARIDTSDVLHMNFTPEEFKIYELRPGDILLNEGQSLEWVGRPAIYRGEVPGACFQNTLVRFRAYSCVLPEFALLVFRAYLHSQRFQRIAKWTTNIAHLGAQRFAELEFPVPPLAEQQRIIAEAEALLSDLDAGVVALKRVRSNLKRYRASVLKAACEGRLVPTEAELARAEGRDYEPADKLLERILNERQRKWEDKRKGKSPGGDTWKPHYTPLLSPDDVLGGLPKGWCWASIDQLAHVGTGATPLRSRRAFYEGGTVAWVTSGALNDSFVRFATEFVTGQALAETNLTLYPPRTLLVAMYGEGKTRGKCSELLIPATTNQAIAALAFDGEAHETRDFVKVFLHASYEAMRRSSSGGVQPNLNLGIIRRLCVPLPPLAEQARIVEAVHRSLSVIEQLESTLDAQSKRAARLLQSILKRAFEGKLVPQDPNDEPPSVLLERIRQERASPTVKSAPEQMSLGLEKSKKPRASHRRSASS